MYAAAGITPVASHARDACDRPHCHAASTVALDADTNANASRPSLGQPLSQVNDRFFRKPGDRGSAGRRELENARAKCFPSYGVLCDELPILLAFGQHDMQQPEGKRGICSWHRREVPIARRSGAGPDRIDGDDRRPVLPRL